MLNYLRVAVICILAGLVIFLILAYSRIEGLKKDLVFAQQQTTNAETALASVKQVYELDLEKLKTRIEQGNALYLACDKNKQDNLKEVKLLFSKQLNVCLQNVSFCERDKKNLTSIINNQEVKNDVKELYDQIADIIAPAFNN